MMIPFGAYVEGGRFRTQTLCRCDTLINQKKLTTNLLIAVV